MNKFPFREIFHGNLHESILANAIASSGFPRNIFHKRKLCLNGNNKRQFNAFHETLFFPVKMRLIGVNHRGKI